MTSDNRIVISKRADCAGCVGMRSKSDEGGGSTHGTTFGNRFT